MSPVPDQPALPLYGDPHAPDAALAAEIARRARIDLPDQCIAGVAMNARLLQQHYDVLMGRTND